MQGQLCRDDLAPGTPALMLLQNVQQQFSSGGAHLRTIDADRSDAAARLELHTVVSESDYAELIGNPRMQRPGVPREKAGGKVAGADGGASLLPIKQLDSRVP